jgi:murein hydrolase activator
MPNYRAASLALFALLVCTHPALAAKNTTPASPQRQLKQQQAAMEAARKKAAELEAKAAKIKDELAPLQAEMVKLAGIMQETETRLNIQEAELARLDAERAERQETLNARKRQMGESISAMVQLQRVPPQALVARPGSVKETIRAGQLLAVLSEQLQNDAKELEGIVLELQAAQTEVTSKKTAIEEEQSALDSRKRELESRMKDRATLQTKLLADRDSEKKKLAKLANDAKNLQELIAKLDRAEQSKAKVQRYNAAEIARLDKQGGAALRGAKKQLHLPVSGKVVSRFGQRTADGSDSRGIRIRARSGAAVTAPFKGSVVFTGPFLDYGKMVIIRHPGGYHTLLAGISQIRCAPGQMVVEGEPIGTMGSRAPGNELYVELRNHSTPVNPAEWFSGL